MGSEPSGGVWLIGSPLKAEVLGLARFDGSGSWCAQKSIPNTTYLLVQERYLHQLLLYFAMAA